MLYLMAYGVTTLASFGLLSALGRDGERDVTLDSIAGLGAARPGIAAALSICLFSLLGFPGTLGFIGKWYILTAVLEQHQAVLAVVLVLTSVVSAGYYLPVIMAMYMKPARVPLAHTEVGLPPVATWVIAVSVVAILVLGVIPVSVLDLAGQSAQALLGATGRAVAGP
jgi:NADH-quinone oxidoreductase subunit N